MKILIEELRLGTMMVPSLKNNGYWEPYEFDSCGVFNELPRYDMAQIIQFRPNGRIDLRGSSGQILVGCYDEGLFTSPYDYDFDSSYQSLSQHQDQIKMGLRKEVVIGVDGILDIDMDGKKESLIKRIKNKHKKRKEKKKKKNKNMIFMETDIIKNK